MVYFFFSHVLVQFVLITVTASTAMVAAFAAYPPLQSAIQSLPGWAQFLLAVLFADIAQAGLHRLYHKIGALWRLHAVHHSSPAMDWLAGTRVHVVELVLTRIAVLLPLVLLGFSQGAVNAYVVLVGIQAVVAHANVRINFGWLEYLIVTPRYHHWHHARHIDYVDKNYAIHLPVVDMVMGSFKRPPSGVWPEEYGIMEREYVPRGFFAQLKSPFVKERPYEDFVGQGET
jgi:lathosterol oxidase